MLTVEKIAEWMAYDSETGVFTWKKKPNRRIKIGSVAGRISLGYIKIRINNRDYAAHRLAWALTHGYCPQQIDHINHKRSDNRISNLRECDAFQNAHNTPIIRSNRSGVKGIWYDTKRKRWIGQVMSEGINYRTKRFALMQDAVRAVCALREKLHNNFTCH